MGENMEKEQWMKESLQMQKASWIQDEITKRREREDELLQQIFMEQKMLQELDEDMDEPFGQDNYKSKPNSMVAKMELLPETIEAALQGKQIQPVLQEP